MKNKNLEEQLFKKRKYILLDGGLATELERRGHNLDHSLWSAHLLRSRPEEIRNVHSGYLNAGSDCLITSSYQASIPGLMAEKLSIKESEELIRRSVILAAEARESYLVDHAERSSKILIAASIGPYGAYLADGSEYHGNYGISFSELMDFHKSRWDILADSSPDLFACETIPSVLEAEVLKELLLGSPGMLAWISFSCSDDRHISDGTPIGECAKLFEDVENAVAVGINCTAPRYIPSLIREVRQAIPSKEVVVYPNMGSVYDGDLRQWEDSSESFDFGSASVDWFNLGARFIGGCCQTGPDQIKAIKTSLDRSIV